METRTIVKRNTYYDSVTLMQISSRLVSQPGIVEAAAMMATPANLAVMEDAGLLSAASHDVNPNDLIITFQGDDSAIEAVLVQL
ncbi:MAG TPA: hypothetical protein PLV24_13345, partial [Anaerolineaceae bacterium]|nr:hypothetical protein [Anaerolineaceae bacterium]